jgi:hypothetical protein
MLLARPLRDLSMNRAFELLTGVIGNVPSAVYRALGSRWVRFEGCAQGHYEKLTFQSRGLSTDITCIAMMECVCWRSVRKAKYMWAEKSM